MSLLNRKRTSKRTEKNKKKENSPGNEVPGQKAKVMPLFCCHSSISGLLSREMTISNIPAIGETQLKFCKLLATRSLVHAFLLSLPWNKIFLFFFFVFYCLVCPLREGLEVEKPCGAALQHLQPAYMLLLPELAAMAATLPSLMLV